MIGHYLWSAVAGVRKAPLATATKVLALAAGLFAMVVVMAVIGFWRSADQEILPPDGRVVLITTSVRGETGQTDADSAMSTMSPLADLLREEAPQLKAVARMQPFGSNTATVAGGTFDLRGINAEPSFLEIFNFRFVRGDRASALRRQDGVILSRDAAERMFGTVDVVDRRLELGDGPALTIMGVFEPHPRPNLFDLQPDYIAALDQPQTGAPGNWLSRMYYTYALLPEGADFGFGSLQNALDRIVETRAPEDVRELRAFRFGVLPVERVAEIRLAQHMFGPVGAPPIATLLVTLGALVLAVSCLNYANLATAQILAGARQTGMRRVVGAGRLGVLAQCWVEVALASALAALVAIIAVWLIAPALKAQTGIDLWPGVASGPVIATLGAVLVGTTLACGAYPALEASRVRPAEALRITRYGRGTGAVIQVLVGIQFSAASVLMILLALASAQNAHMRELALKEAEDPIVVLPMGYESGVPGAVLAAELRAYPQILAASQTSSPSWSGTGGSNAISRNPAESYGADRVVDSLDIGHGYFEVYQQALLAGRNFTPGIDSSLSIQAMMNPEPGVSVPVLIDRALSDALGFASPQAAIGQRLYPDNMEIIGVVENRPYQIKPADGEGGTIYKLWERPFNRPVIRVSANDLEGGLSAIHTVWERLAPDSPLEITFEDDLFREQFREFEQTQRLLTAPAIIALLVSAAGLIGLATHVATRRRHEIAVRKTLGSSTSGAVRLLLADFSRPAIVANLIAWPLGYLAAQTYLSAFAHRIDISIWPFAASMLITLAIAWLAVGGQTWRAATVRPADVLRDA